MRAFYLCCVCVESSMGIYSLYIFFFLGHVHGGLRRHQSWARSAGDDRDVDVRQRRSTGEWRGWLPLIANLKVQYIPLSENQRKKKERMETNDGELWDSLSIADYGADMWIGEKSFL